MSDLVRLEAAAAGLESLPSDEETADYLGRLDKVIRTLSAHKRMVLSEVAGPLDGKDYRLIEKREASRSYNTRLLLADFADAGYTIEDLIQNDVIRLSWQWTNTRNLAVSTDIGLRIAGHEITEDEADHIGEVWRSSLSVEGVKS